ncbi:hypothetical protein HF325_005233 [Metschnikowia pulcherrima]|uniref:FCP1 homology domain-containing protein n=1 Tax=Metschnikowia pulcherrima TaxID=27326 RepID=A0A8H7GPV2_9ASCO|nr:hypothetical protein HF325_005233 [Metschnikowia pulcherrima]
MGLFSSLFCCGGGSSDTEDKHKASARSVPPKRSVNGKAARPALKPAQTTNVPPESATQKAPASEATPLKAALEDDHSLNESDTLTVPNDDKLDKKENGIGSNGVSKSGNDPDNSAVAKESTVADESAVPAGVIASVDETELLLEKKRRGYHIHAFNAETGYLLGKKDTQRFGNKKCLVLDLDETLVHSSFKYLRTADFVIPVEIEDQVHHVYVIKRPGVDEFLRQVGKWYEVVVFTASVAKYGDPLLNKLDIHRAVHQRLFRDSCYTYQGNFIKNLLQLGRPLQDLIIIDNSPASYIFHPQHSVPISSWFSDTHDNELLDLLPLLEDLAKPNVDDVSLVLDTSI